MKPLISIIVPAYNAESHIKEAIESVLNQTYENLEIIVVDDGSSDKTSEIIKSIQDPRVVYFYQGNQGQSAARNTGIKATKGKYVAFLDSDDLFLPEKLEEQIGFLESHPDCEVCYCKIYHFYNKETEKLFYNPIESHSGFIFDKLLERNFINPLSVVLRKEILTKYGGFKNDWRRCDEQYLWLKLAFHQVKFCYLDKVLAYYRIHQKSLSGQAQYLKETAEKTLELLDLVKSWLKPEERKRYPFEKLKKSTKRKLFIGRLLTKRNPLSKSLLFLYNLRLRWKLKPI